MSEDIKQYMVDINLPRRMSKEFMELIPEQRQKVSDLMEEGIVTSYSLSSNRSKVWVTIMGTSEEDVMDILTEFPLIKYMKVRIHELAFNDMPTPMPQISLN